MACDACSFEAWHVFRGRSNNTKEVGGGLQGDLGTWLFLFLQFLSKATATNM